jgi:hypothetical protein
MARPMDLKCGDSLENRLDTALIDCATSFTQQALKELVDKTDSALHDQYMPRFNSLLSELDIEREKFQVAKNELIQNLHTRLTALRADDDSTKERIREFEARGPFILGAIPSASTLTRNYSSGKRSRIVQDSEFSQHSASSNHQHKPTSTDLSITETFRKTGMIPVGRGRRQVSEFVNDGVGDIFLFSLICRFQLTQPKTQNIPKRSLNKDDLKPHEFTFRLAHLDLFFVLRCHQTHCSAPYFTDGSSLFPDVRNHLQKHKEHGDVSHSGDENTNEHVFAQCAWQGNVLSLSPQLVILHVLTGCLCQWKTLSWQVCNGSTCTLRPPLANHSRVCRTHAPFLYCTILA